ncbi:MAG: bifunctional phosphoribosyl-AMP cyclohydrolase/phosphoribosyl-ATP diphosphatase HisIE [Flavobacteriales bacterium]|nr:bifunctional phosphoribosyl-AMP cyclohydrolase/phosphoribosyl-ATP diphosphatase HisIE [Flavobacteriales bacterium]
MQINFGKLDGLIPVIIQDRLSLQVLMLGFMNQEALDKTKNEKVVTFYSRSKNRLWTKGESSGNFLYVKEIALDCDLDTLLIKVDPKGPTCHRGTVSCFDKFESEEAKGFVYTLQETIKQRIENKESNSYTYKLTQKGINKVAQKVGEEAVEVVIEAKDNNDELFLNESADLLYHYLILLHQKGFTLEDVEKILKSRSK